MLSGGTSLTAALKQLQQVHVTQQMLVETGAGKEVKALSKSKLTEVSNAAKAVVKAWKQCILQA